MSFSDELPARCDVVNVLDAFRHFGDPHGLLRLWRRIIREGGLLLIAEPADAGTLDANTADVAAVIGLGCLLLYCDVGGRTGDPATEPLSPQPTAHSPQPTAHKTAARRSSRRWTTLGWPRSPRPTSREGTASTSPADRHERIG